MEDHNEQIRKLEMAKGTLVGERRAIVNRLQESAAFLDDATLLKRHQEAIEAIDRIIEDEKKRANSSYK